MTLRLPPVMLWLLVLLLGCGQPPPPFADFPLPPTAYDVDYHTGAKGPTLTFRTPDSLTEFERFYREDVFAPPGWSFNKAFPGKRDYEAIPHHQAGTFKGWIFVLENDVPPLFVTVYTVTVSVAID